MLNRTRFRAARGDTRTFIIADLFPASLRPLKARIIGRDETYAQLPLPAASSRDWTYEPIEESA